MVGVEEGGIGEFVACGLSDGWGGKRKRLGSKGIFLRIR
jgi:hypothetical protein